MEEVPIDLAEAVIPHHQWQRGIKATTTYCVCSFVMSNCKCVCAEIPKNVAVVKMIYNSNAADPNYNSKFT